MAAKGVAADEVLRARFEGQQKLIEEQWASHLRAHEDLARSLAEYKQAANEWRSTLADVRTSNVTRPEYIAEHKALEARIGALVDRMEANDQAGETKADATHHALELRINALDNALSTAGTERAATYRLFGQARNLILVMFTILGGIIGLLVYLRI